MNTLYWPVIHTAFIFCRAITTDSLRFPQNVLANSSISRDPGSISRDEIEISVSVAQMPS
jgi:hypothetical protein